MSKKNIVMLMMTMILIFGKDVFAATMRVEPSAMDAEKSRAHVAAGNNKKEGDRRVNHMVVAQESGLRDAAVRFQTRDVQSSNSRQEPQAGDVAVAGQDVNSMLLVGLIIALVSIFRRMRRA